MILIERAFIIAKKNTKFNKYTPWLKIKSAEDYLSDKYGGLYNICKIYRKYRDIQ